MDDQIRKARLRSVVWGLAGGLLLMGIYFGIVSAANSFGHALDEFRQIWYWIAVLTLGFGIQAGLYAHVRQTVRLGAQARGATSSLATGCGTSAVSMLACCAHHLTDVLPLMGVTAAAVFLTEYQQLFLLIGVVSNVLGVTYMLSLVARHHLYFDANRWLARLSAVDYQRVFRWEVPALVVALVVGALALYGPVEGMANEAPATLRGSVSLKPQKSNDNGIWVVAGGEYDPSENLVTFSVRFTTHSGRLGFQVVRIAALSVDGKEFQRPATWEGSPPGGHHRSGSLAFRDLPSGVETLVLKLSDPGRLGTRTFQWDLGHAAEVR